MMRALEIDPIAREVRERRFDDAREFKELVATASEEVGRFPNGDRILTVGHDNFQRECFSIGGAKPRQRAGLIVGCKDDVGERRSAISPVETIRSLTRFSSIPDFQFETTSRSITRDIEEFVREIGSQPAKYVDVEPLGKAEPGGCFRNVSAVVASHGGRSVYGWVIWERPKLFATGEFHALWERPDGVLVDITPKADGERRILFSVDSRYPSSFDWLKRPGNLRYRIYRPEPVDMAEILKGLGGSGRSYNRKRAARAGVSLEKWLASKHADPLVAGIEARFRTCGEIEEILDVHHDGVFCRQPTRLAVLEDRKRTEHESILSLAAKVFAGGMSG